MQVVVLAAGLWSCIVCPFAQDMATVLAYQKSHELKVEWGASGRKGMRKEMQDAYAVQSSNGQILFSLYDGHGGSEAALTAACNLPNEIFKHGEAVAYLDVDALLEDTGCTSGTTAVTARVIPLDNGTYKLLLAWAGDSRAVLVHEHGLPRLETIDHKPEDVLERERIQRAGGTIYRHIYKTQDGHEKCLLRVARERASDCRTSGRVGRAGGLSMTRALGDAQWPNTIISPEPEKLECALQPGVDGYLILASDGLWDTVSTTEAAHIVSRAYPLFEGMDQESVARLVDDSDACIKDGESTGEDGSMSAALAARALRDAAYNYGSSDNITALVVRFIWLHKQGAPHGCAAHDGFDGPTALGEFGGLTCCML